MSETGGSLSPKAAAVVAREWIDGRLPKPADRYAWSQMRYLMSELAALAIIESLRLQEDADALCDRLGAACDILTLAWYNLNPTETRSSKCLDDAATSEQTMALEKRQNQLWGRHDPQRAFLEGYNSLHYVGSLNQEEMASVIADYLAKPYLRHAVLDWIFLDILISSEICAFGEVIKRDWLPGKRHPLTGYHYRYWEATGNFAAMTKFDWRNLFKRAARRLLWIFVIPIASIWVSFHFGIVGLGRTLTLTYALALTLIAGAVAINIGMRLLRKLGGAIDPFSKVQQLWLEMYEVWKRLDGPVVNPSHVREAMTRAAGRGAVWTNTTWSLIDRVVAADAAVWVVERTK